MQMVVEIKKYGRVWFLTNCYELDEQGSAEVHDNSSDARDSLEHAGYSGVKNFKMINERFEIVCPDGVKALCCIRTI